MRYRTFGRTGWQVSEIGYGMWGMGGWSGSDDKQSLESLQRSVDLGCNFFDTAYVYGNGRSENLLGELVSDANVSLWVLFDPVSDVARIVGCFELQLQR